jgi:hypothetical protein
MKRLLVLSVLAGLILTGCCTRQELDSWSRFDGSENRPSGVCGIFSGFGTTEVPDRWGAVYSPVGVSEYGELLCGHLELEDYATCVNRVWAHYRERQRTPQAPGETTSGPFAVVVYDRILLGSYWSDPFSASFSVSDDGVTCRGSYSALYGDQKPVFDVTCDNGMRGKARIVRDRSGSNGIGGLEMDDGAQGRIVFGHATVGGLQDTGS